VAMMATYRHFGRFTAGMVGFVNLALMMLGAVSFLVVEGFSRGATMRWYAAAVCGGPFLGYGIDVWLLTLWENANR
jgi:hypothetical protein